MWSYYEVIDGSEVPFPSLADVGFLLFPVAATIGLWSWLGSQGTLVARGRDLLDGAIIAVSLLALSWMTVLGSVLADASGGRLSVLLSVAYPVGDVMLGTLALLALARGHGRERAVLAILALGLAFLAAADSAYTYLVTVGEYTSADVVSSGWVFGFLLVAAAAGAELGAPSSAASVAVPERRSTGSARSGFCFPTSRSRPWVARCSTSSSPTPVALWSR